MLTELRIDGANCSYCLNDTIAALRAAPGVRKVDTSAVSGCLAIDHDGVAPATLVELVRQHLHGVALAGAEIVMVSVDPLVVDLGCCHRSTGHRP